MCVVCKSHSSPENFIRIVRTPQGTIEIDTKGHADGRGAYICKNPECAILAKKQQVFRRVFNIQVDDALYDSLIEKTQVNKGE